MTSEDDPTQQTGADETASADDDSLIDRMRDSGAGVEDPNIVGRATPGNVEEHVREDEAPEI